MTHFETYQAIVEQTNETRLKAIVLSEFTVAELILSDDLQFGLSRWDKIAPMVYRYLSQANHSVTLSKAVCLLKHVARIIIKENQERGY